MKVGRVHTPQPVEVAGRRFRALTVVGVYTRECLAIAVGQNLKAMMGGGAAENQQRGAPKVPFCNNGSEFASQPESLWKGLQDATPELDYSGLGKRCVRDSRKSFRRCSARKRLMYSRLRALHTGSDRYPAC